MTRARRKATSGAGARALRMAGLTAGVAGSYVGYLAQRLFLGEEARETKKRSAHARAGRRIRDELLALRGPAMKLGQALSLHTDVFPPEMLAELTKLQMEAPGMHPSLVSAQFTGSLGRRPEEVFRAFAPDPFAAASLGQVHRAVTRAGRPVAVKIQYPGIREAVTNDFRWFRNLSRAAQASGHLPKAALDEMEQQIRLETDYVREAANIEFFRKGLQPLDFVSVPEVHHDLSTDRVLTMSIVPGRHLDAFLATRPSQARRDLVGARLFELFYFQQLRLEAFHADPHWGNYLFGDDGTIGLVDFGCVKYFESDAVDRLRSLYLYPGRRDTPEFQRLIEDRYGAPGQKMPAAVRRALTDFSEHFYKQVYPPDAAGPPEPFDFSDPAFLRNYMELAGKLARAKGTMPVYIFLARAEIGLYTTLHRLRARVPTSAIVRRYLNR